MAFIVIAITSLWTIAFFSIYKKEDVRITATNWVNQNIPLNSFILTETGNTLEVPLSGDFRKVTFEFYELDQKGKLSIVGNTYHDKKVSQLCQAVVFENPSYTLCTLKTGLDYENSAYD